MEILNPVSSFLGGGLVSGLITYWGTTRSERRKRRIENLKAELQDLYGPLRFLSLWNERLFSLSSSILNASRSEYESKGWSEEKSTQDSLKQKIEKTLGVSNQYIQQVIKNNEHVATILEKYFFLIDPIDVELFAQFTVDFIRYKTEVAEEEAGLPLEIYQRVGEISFMRPEFIQTVKACFDQKKKQLEDLLS